MNPVRAISFFFLLSVMPTLPKAQQVAITIDQIRGAKGQLRVALFESQKDFLHEKTCWTTFIEKSDITHLTYSFNVTIRSGIFGLSVLDDENGNGKMDYTLLGIPREGFGFSGYALKGLKKPAFSDFDFSIQPNETKRILVKMTYL